MCAYFAHERAKIRIIELWRCSIKQDTCLFYFTFPNLLHIYQLTLKRTVSVIVFCQAFHGRVHQASSHLPLYLFSSFLVLADALALAKVTSKPKTKLPCTYNPQTGWVSLQGKCLQLRQEAEERPGGSQGKLGKEESLMTLMTSSSGALLLLIVSRFLNTYRKNVRWPART